MKDTTLTIFIPDSFTAEQFEFWIRQRWKTLATLGAFIEPAPLIDWLVNEEVSLCE